MTYREAFENALIELNKVQAPSLLIEDFIYLFNKAVLKYINKKYNNFEVSQLLTDDLRVLLKTVKLVPKDSSSDANVFKDSWTVELPEDYVHILNCICEFRHTNSDKCGNNSYTTFLVGANKLDSSEWPHIINNYYMKPSAKRPYYYISNITDEPEASLTGSPANKTRDTRYGNSTVPVMLIKCGNDRQLLILDAVYIDYLRAPKYISIDKMDLDSITDTTPQLEFPDYVIFEIINELVTLILENGKDLRVQTFSQVTKSIPSQI